MATTGEGSAEILGEQLVVKRDHLGPLEGPVAELVTEVQGAVSDTDRRQALAIAAAGIRQTGRAISKYKHEQWLRAAVAKDAADPSSKLGTEVSRQIGHIRRVHGGASFVDSLAKRVETRLIEQTVVARRSGAGEA